MGLSVVGWIVVISSFPFRVLISYLILLLVYVYDTIYYKKMQIQMIIVKLTILSICSHHTLITDMEISDESIRHVRERLESRLEADEASGCWNWTGTRVGNGYGYIWLSGGPKYTHRVSAMLFLDFELSSRLWVLHECDNPRCCNPRHLRVGTRVENMRDAALRGRVSRGKLARANVVEIKSLLGAGHTHAAIAEAFGVTTSTIGQIARGETWADVLPETKLAPRKRGRRRKDAEAPILVAVATDAEERP